MATHYIKNEHDLGELAALEEASVIGLDLDPLT